MKISTYLQTALITLSLLYPLSSFGEQSSDINGDGITDPISVVIDSDGNLKWYTSASSLSNGSVSYSDPGNPTQLGENGNHVAIGYYLTQSSVALGIVKKDGNGGVEWVIDNGDGTTTLSFGTKTQTLIGGADFDGNGITDIAVATKKSVTARLNPFIDGESAREVSHTFTKKGKAFYGDIDGDGSDEVCSGRKSWSRIRCINLVSGGSESSYKIRKLKGYSTPVNVPRGGSGQGDWFAFKKGKKTKIIDITTGEIKHTLKGRGTLIVGNFQNSGSAYQVGVVKNGAMRGLDLNDGTTFIMDYITSQPSGIPVDLNNINKFQTDLQQACPGGISTLPRGWLWKPASDVDDPRGGKAVVVISNNKPRVSPLDIVATNGKKICYAGIKGPYDSGVNCNSSHYYVGGIYGCNKTGSELISLARAQSGSPNVYIRASGKCYGPFNPNSRTGAICN